MRVALPFGAGLDRYTGVMQTRPGLMADIRNMRPRGGKLELRGGVTVESRIPARDGNACSAICHFQTVRSHGEALVVSYHDGDRSVHVWRTDIEGQSPTHLGKWFNLPAGLPTPPRFTGADSYQMAFLAHDEPIDSRRAATQVYRAVAGTLGDLQADLRGQGDEDIKFRGVSTWNSYLVGWGFGTAGEVRPELVRISLPATPATFKPEHYFIAGDRGSPVVACRRLGSGLIVLKPTETFQVVGTSHLNFGIVNRYELAGCLANRLAISVEGTVYCWGFEGPWAATPDGAQDLETPLDLEGPAPADLAPMGDIADGFAVYVPGDRVIEWHFGDRVYALSLEGGPRWTYTHRRGCRAASGGLLYVNLVGSDGPGSAPTGHATITSVVAVDDTATINWANNSQDGNELLEIFLGIRHSGFFFLDPAQNVSWEQRFPSAAVTAASSQSTQLKGLDPGREYLVAVRYRRGNKYHADYSSANPSDWPATSRQVFSPRPPAPTRLAATWRRVSLISRTITLDWTVLPGQYARYEVYRDGSLLATTNAGASQYVDHLGLPNPAEFRYHVVALVGNRRSVESEVVAAWNGPPEPTEVTLTPFDTGENLPPGKRRYALVWQRGAGLGSQYQVGRGDIVDNDPRGPLRSLKGGRAVAVGGVVADALDPQVRVRNYLPVPLSDDIVDYSRWAEPE